jgi:hypothetical protein
LKTYLLEHKTGLLKLNVMTRKVLVSITLALCGTFMMLGPFVTAQAATFVTAVDPTRDLSKSERKKVSFKTWVNSPTAKFLKKKESSNNCKAVGYKGMYLGTWQMSAGFWNTYGGKKYAPKANLATCQQQDLVAYKGWLARGWSPWPPAKNFKP